MIEDDMLADLLKTLQAETRLPDETIVKLEDRLRQQFGGERMYISKTPLMRDTWIRGALLQGLPPQRVAQRFGISERTVFRVKARLTKEFK